MLDLSDAFDSDMMDNIIIVRRPEIVDSHGRSGVTPSTINAFAVVTMAGPDDLERLTDVDIFGRVISIVSQTRLQGAIFNGATQTKYKPDWVVWRGDVYVVKSNDPYPQFGRGWSQSLAESIDLMNNDPSLPTTGATLDMNFILDQSKLQ